MGGNFRFNRLAKHRRKMTLAAQRNNCIWPLSSENWRLHQRQDTPPSFSITKIQRSRAIPKDLPPRSTLFGYFELWDYDGTLDRIHHSLYVKCREAIGREASPTACVIDSQSVKGAEKGGPASIRRATMRVRRSKVRSATSLSTR